MSGQSAKRRKTSAQAPAGVPAFDNLPPELLETILGFLDVRTLCTARLVCGHFRSAASRFLHSVELPVKNLRSRPETTLDNFPNLSRVTVFDVEAHDLVMLAQSPVTDAITHLRTVGHLRLVPRRGQIAAGSPHLPLPNLMSLTVCYADRWAFAFPRTLRELSLERSVTLRTANLVTRLTNLTCLQIDISGMRKPFGAVTALTTLQRLDVTCGLSFIPLVAELTLLTHLHFRGTRERYPLMPAGSRVSALASLTCLHNLVHLGFEHRHSWGVDRELRLLASIGTLTSLRSLDVGLLTAPGGSAFNTLWMTAFQQLTALRLEGYNLNASFLPTFDLQRLQVLSLSQWMGLHRGGVAALRQATGLTRLELWRVGTSVGPGELGIALSYMSRLRALSLCSATDFPATSSIKAIGLPTELTRLELCGGCVTTDADLEVCIGLKKLRVLCVSVNSSFRPAPTDRITPETVFALAKLPELCNLKITARLRILGRDLEDDVRSWLNAERHDKGWPPLELNVSW